MLFSHAFSSKAWGAGNSFVAPGPGGVTPAQEKGRPPKEPAFGDATGQVDFQQRLIADRGDGGDRRADGRRSKTPVQAGWPERRSQPQAGCGYGTTSRQAPLKPAENRPNAEYSPTTRPPPEFEKSKMMLPKLAPMPTRS